MKRVFLTVIFLVVICVMAGCTPKLKQNPVSPQGNQPVPATEAKTEYTVVKPSDVPVGVATWFDTFIDKKGAYIYQHPDYSYLKITPGGSDVKVKDFVNGDSEKSLVVGYTAGDKNESVILRIPSKFISNYKVRANDEELKVEQMVVNATFDSPKENDTITNPASVKGRVAAFEGAFVVRVIDGNNIVLEEKRLQTDGAPAWGSFGTDIQYSVPNTATGKLEIGVYSAKDGAYVKYAEVNVKFAK